MIAESLFKKKEYHDGRSNQRELFEGEEVWVQIEVDAGWTTGEGSNPVLVTSLI